MNLHRWHGPKATLDNQLKEDLYAQVLNKWHNTVVMPNSNVEASEYQLFEQWANEAYIKRGIDSFISILSGDNQWLSSLEEQSEILKPKLKAFILDADFLSASEKAFMSRHDFIDASLAFIKRAQSEDAELNLDNIGQAMRNFWIANLLQAIFLKPAKLTDSLYSYSMLYPYTDNLMDEGAENNQKKREFCQRLSITLNSFAKSKWSDLKLSSDETRIHELCQLIYDDFDKEEQERVQFGLTWIHEAQMDSLKQQQPNLLPYELDILRLSFDKGGSSLIADALLVEPDLSHESLIFCYHLGAVLQLCDDLQDTCEDAQNGHQTLFSQLKDHYVFDNLLDHLLSFSFELEKSAEYAGIKPYDLIQSVLIPNTNLLLIVSAVLNDQLFSRRWIDSHKKYLPVTPNGIKRIQRHLKKKLKTTALGKSAKAVHSLSFKELSKVATF